MTTTVRGDPTELIPDAVERCLDLAGTWYAWDGRPLVSEPTVAADWASFTEADLNEARNRLRRLGQVYARGCAAWTPRRWTRPAARHGRSARSSSTSPA